MDKECKDIIFYWDPYADQYINNNYDLSIYDNIYSSSYSKYNHSFISNYTKNPVTFIQTTPSVEDVVWAGRVQDDQVMNIEKGSDITFDFQNNVPSIIFNRSPSGFSSFIMRSGNLCIKNITTINGIEYGTFSNQSNEATETDTLKFENIDSLNLRGISTTNLSIYNVNNAYIVTLLIYPNKNDNIVKVNNNLVFSYLNIESYITPFKIESNNLILRKYNEKLNGKIYYKCTNITGQADRIDITANFAVIFEENSEGIKCDGYGELTIRTKLFQFKDSTPRIQFENTSLSIIGLSNTFPINFVPNTTNPAPRGLFDFVGTEGVLRLHSLTETNKNYFLNGEYLAINSNVIPSSELNRYFNISEDDSGFLVVTRTGATPDAE